MLTAADIEISDILEHARTKELWAGALVPTEDLNLRGVRVSEEGVPTFVSLADVKITPAVLQTAIEAFTNTSDHYQETVKAELPRSQRVTKIDITFDRASGTFAVENNGPGIPVEVHPKGTAVAGREVRVPEVIFAVPLAGSNIKKPPYSVKGGTNGLGAKLINVHSTRFRIETVGHDGKKGLCGYVQEFTNRARDPFEAPALYPNLKEKAARAALSTPSEHTRLEWLPAYEELGHAGELALKHIAADLEAACLWQAYLLAAYVGQKVAVTFNGTRCPTTTAKALAEFVSAGVPGAQLHPLTFKADKKHVHHAPYQWGVVAMILPGKQAEVGNVGTVNGVYCTSGSHIDYLRKVVGTAVGAKMLKLRAAGKNAATIPTSETCRHLSFVVVAPIPGAKWDGQNKRKLTMARSGLSPFVPAASTLGKVANQVAMYNIASSGRGKARKSRKKTVELDKYMPARRAGTAQAPKTSLIVTEGDSASVFARAILTTRSKTTPKPKRGEPTLTFEWYGIMTTGGVPMNALRFTTTTTDPSGNKVVMATDRLKANKKLNALMEVLGLQYACTYETDEEVATLRYGRVLIATDQDVDGVGKILPLVLVFFHTFWPALLTRGFVYRCVTPLIRAYPKSKGKGQKLPPVEFYTDPVYEEWAAGVDLDQYVVNYYKGLATHSDPEVAAMHETFLANTYRVEYDKGAPAAFAQYYEKDPRSRKLILSRPFATPSPEYFKRERESQVTTCSNLLAYEATLYKLDDIERKIPSYSDGLYVSSRKILDGALERFKQSNALLKVFQLGGHVAATKHYHHGDASLNGGIVGMAQRFPGAKRFPYLVGVGQFGTRHLGGKDAGSPRYIRVRLATRFVRALFPAADRWLLDFVREDGHQAQPRNFLPILPPIIESLDLPAEGWIHVSHARDLGDVLKLLRAYIAGDEVVHRIAKAHEDAGLATLRELCGAGLVAAKDLRALAEGFPLRPSTRGFGQGLTEAERARLVRPGFSPTHGRCDFSWGIYELLKVKGADVVHVKELPMGMKTADLKAAIKKKHTHSTKNPSGVVKKVVDDSLTDRVSLYIELVEGGLGRVRATRCRHDDPVAEFFGLRASLWPHLNYYDSKLCRVREFGRDYWSVFMAWAPDRRDMYRRRLERENLLLGLRVRAQKEIVRYIDTAASLAMGEKASEAEQVAALEAAGFPPFDAGLLQAPRYTPTEHLADLVTAGPKASHDYILNLRERDLARTARDRRVATIQKLEAQQKTAQEHLADAPFAGAAIWAREVDAVVAAIAEGDRCGWWGNL